MIWSVLLHIWLNVTFGRPDNFHKEPLTFEVVYFPDKVTHGA